jgi:hypothetical protein
LCQFPQLRGKPERMSLFRTRERVSAEFPAESVANLRYNLGLRRMIKLRVLQLMDRMLVVDRVGREMNQV